MPLELIALAATIGISVLVTVITLHHAAVAETVAARSAPSMAEVIDRRSAHVTVSFTWNGSETSADAPVQSSGGYQRGLRYPILVDTRQPTSIRMAMEPYDAVGPIVGMWLIAAIVVVPVGDRIVQRLSARRKVRTGPWQTMFAVAVANTPRFVVVQLHAPRDWPGSRRGILLMPRVEPWTDLTEAREVTVCGTLNTLDSPPLVIDGRAHVPASRLYFGLPLVRSGTHTSRSVRRSTASSFRKP